MDEAPHLYDALARLRAFRQGWSKDDTIDEDSGLTPDDLDVLIAFVTDFPDSD